MPSARLLRSCSHGNDNPADVVLLRLRAKRAVEGDFLPDKIVKPKWVRELSFPRQFPHPFIRS